MQSYVDALLDPTPKNIQNMFDSISSETEHTQICYGHAFMQAAHKLGFESVLCNTKGYSEYNNKIRELYSTMQDDHLSDYLSEATETAEYNLRHFYNTLPEETQALIVLLGV